MIVKVTTLIDFDDDGNSYETKYLLSTGCGCCAEYLPITRENVDKAIKEMDSFKYELYKVLNEET